jgi:hypothetical protein
MAAAALPIALVFGIVAELVSGLLSWPLGGDRAWWRRVGNFGPEVVRLAKDRQGLERVSVVEAGGAAASMLGAGMAAAGALGIGPGDLTLLYLALALASVGAMVVALGGEAPTSRAGGRRLPAALAEPAFAVALGVMFLRYGALDIDAVRGTQQVLGTGLLLAPGLAAAGLVTAALAFTVAGAMRLSSSPGAQRWGRAQPFGAGPSLLARLCRWSVAGATSLVCGVLLAGGGLEPLTLEGMLPAGLGALGVAVAIGSADAFLGRLTGAWRLATLGFALLLAAGAAAMVVLA